MRTFILTGAMRDDAEAGEASYGFGEAIGDGHWNERGHASAARIIGEHVCRGTREPPP